MQMNQENPVGWALVGASNIARQHMVGAIRAQAGHMVQAVMSSSQARADQFAAAFNIPTAYSSLDAILADPMVQVVYVSTTNDLHHEQVMAAAAAGKHVLCEKPLAMTHREAVQMARACRRAGVVLATNHHLRNAATHRAMRDLIAGGAIGRLLFARVFHAVYLPAQLQGWRIDKPHAGGGVILDIAVHDIDTLRFTLGSELVEVTGLSQSTSMAKNGLEDGAMAVLRFENGVLAQVHEAFTVAHASTGVEYHGDAGSIVARNVMTQQPVGEVFLRTAEGERQIPIQHEDLYVRGVAAFCGAIAGRGGAAATDEDGVRSLEGALALLQSCKTGERQVVRRETI